MKKEWKEITYAESVKDGIQKKDLNEILNRIKSDQNLELLIKELRSIKDENIQREFKTNNLPVFNVATFSGSKRRCEDFIEAEFILFDLDHIENAAELKSYIISNTRTAFCFISPRGNGLKFAYRLDKAVTSDEEFRKVYNFYSKQIELEYGILPDPKCANSQQPCFLSYDPDMYVNSDSQKVSIQVSSGKNNSLNLQDIAQYHSYSIDNEKLGEIADYLAGKINDYSEWVTVGLALTNLGEEGRELFIKISQNKRYNDSLQVVNEKYSELLKSTRQKISLGSLYFIAKNHGMTIEASVLNITILQNDTVKELEERFKFDLNRDPNKLIGYDLNKFPTIAKNFDGIQPGFYIIAADANVGKTALLANLCLDLLETNPDTKVLYFSLDDSLVETSYRFLGIRADLPINTIKAPLRDPANLPKVQAVHLEYLELFKSNRFFLYDLRTLDKADRIEEIIKTENNQKLVVFLDAIFNIPTANSGDIRVANMERAQYLKSLVDKYRIPLIVTSEIRKKPVEAAKNRQPGMHDIMETGKYAYNANAILMLSMKNAENKVNTSELKVEFVKNKFSSFKGDITLLFTRDKGIMSEVPIIMPSINPTATKTSIFDQTEVMD